MTSPTNQSFGKYQLLKKLATGGMAEVWLAKQTGIEGFNRHVVVKRILPHLAEDPEFIQMFLNEAKIAARFNHPNIAQIYDLGEEGGQYFIAMEYVHGEDLGRVMRRAWNSGQWVARPVALRIIADACQALHYAHSRADDSGRPLKVVHRDISPQNILISFDGSVKLVDFGIAKAADQASNTKSGALKGKFAYMAPEQAAGGALDSRTDLFALGLVLYELLTGVRPLKRDAELATLAAALECEIDRPSDVAEVPAEVDDVVMRAIQKAPADRYQDARQMQMAIEEYLVREATVVTSMQVAQLMEQLFADRLQEEARLGAPVPATQSKTSHPASSEDLGQAVDDPVTEAPGSTVDEDPPAKSQSTEASAPFSVPSGAVVPSRRYAKASEPARSRSGEKPAPAEPPKKVSSDRHTAAAPAPMRSSRKHLDAEYDDPPPVEEPRASNANKPRVSAPSVVPVRKSKPSHPSKPKVVVDASATPVNAGLGLTHYGDVTAMRAKQLQRTRALVAVLGVIASLVLIVLFREPLGRLLGTGFLTRTGVPVLLSVTSNPKTHVTVVPPSSGGKREPIDLGESPLERVSGACIGDTIVLSNEDRAIRYKEVIEGTKPGEEHLIRKTFLEATLKVRTSPSVRSGEVYRGTMKVGNVGLPMKLFEGEHHLEVRSPQLRQPVEFEVHLTPNQILERHVDVAPNLEGGR